MHISMSLNLIKTARYQLEVMYQLLDNLNIHHVK
jgi:hypothetical protein